MADEADVAATEVSIPEVDPELDAKLNETATTALERFGDLETAGVAIIVAYEAGYSFDQVVAGVMEGTLTPEGTIEGVEPQAMAVINAVPARLGAVGDVERIREAFRKAGDTEDDTGGFVFLYWLLDGMSLGMSAEELIEGIVLGDLIEKVHREQCIDFYGSDATRQKCLDKVDDAFGPAEDEAEDTTVATSAPPPSDGEEVSGPTTYEGEGTYRSISYIAADDRTSICEGRGPMQLTINPDATAVFVADIGFGHRYDADGNHSCVDAPGNAWPGSFDEATGTVTIPPPAEGVQGGFTGPVANGTATVAGAFVFTDSVGTSTIEVDVLLGG